jgi:cyclopropane-fatty-acyl-phospholipid synthase
VPAAFFEQRARPAAEVQLLLVRRSGALSWRRRRRPCWRCTAWSTPALADGQRILELGCGWGSLTLWMGEHFPGASITAVSNSASQRAFIEARARERGLANVTVLTRDVNDFEADGPYDRVVSVEMFEHMRNYAELLGRCRRWLHDDGRLFVHIFCHRDTGYFFEDPDGSNDTWMAKHFFENGVMPPFDVFRHFDRDFTVEAETWIDGTHYQRTAEAWLARLDARRDEVRAVFAAEAPGPATADPVAVRVQRWRMFFLAVAEMFGTDGGTLWGVGHYRLAPRPA